MSDQTRELPEQPSLRFLKLEAKRRLAAGEFATLHDAQLAIAREYGLSSWTVLKETVTADPAGPNFALAQVRWLIARFRDADRAAWAAPAHDEMREHFTEDFLAQVPGDTVIGLLTKNAATFREDLVVIDEPTVRSVRTQVGGLRLDAFADAEPPHRLAGAQLYKLGQFVTDDRVADPPAAIAGPVPADALAVARDSFAELGMPALTMAVASTGDRASTGVSGWSLALGWADLDRQEPLTVHHRFMTGAVTQVVTAITVLRLVADGLLELDAPANRSLRTVRLSDEEVTVRELLCHTGGVTNEILNHNPLGAAITDLGSLAGPVIAVSGSRGTVRKSNAGYAVLGQLVADVAGVAYQEAAQSLVLRPLGLAGSFFPASRPERDAVTGYWLDDAGRFEPLPVQVCVIPAMGGLWATAADLARLGVAWGSLLPAELVGEALRPQGPPGGSVPRFGLGWALRPDGTLAGVIDGAPGMIASLFVTPDGGQASAAMTSRLIPNAVEQVNLLLRRSAA